jgi:uncharacterized damage-inducible protein DinB
MALKDSILPEFDNEMATTRRCLARLIAGKLTYKPHEKSWTLAQLATHVATIPSWTNVTLGQSELDIGAEFTPPPPVTSADDAVARFDEHVKGARTAIEAAGDEVWMSSWTLKSKGQTIFTMPKIAVMRGFVLSHIIHHRGQLSVYLRMTGAAVPSIYGPSADESNM